VLTVRLRVLFVFLVIEHQRRKVLHFGVTEHPTAEWALQQVVEAFSEGDTKRYLIRMEFVRASPQQVYFGRVFSLSSTRFKSSSFCPASPSLPSAVRR
jgi:hypothetical protein